MTFMELDRVACYRAIQARDARFDGRFFTAVRTTGIYCRPICPARCPKLENIAFYPSAAAAQAAGFRPCLRCRPECSPEIGAWRGTSSTVSRALGLIAEGALDGVAASVDALALRLGIGERQLRRLFEQHLGASPLAVAQTRRVLLAKQLIHETPMRMVDVAFAAGFGSLRRFNDTFRKLYGRAPSALRRERAGGAARGITLTLGYAPPYDWPALLESLGAQAITGLEAVSAGTYRRTIELDGCHGTLEVAQLRSKHAVGVTIDFADVRALPAIIRRVRNLFDLGSDVSAIGAQLSEDPSLAPLVAERPGLRVPGAWDAFELAVRTIAGEHVTRLVSAFGESLANGPQRELCLVFPRAERLASAELGRLGLSRERAAQLRELARTVVADPRVLDADGDLEAKLTRLRRLPGIDESAAHAIAMRALREPDAFPTRDLSLRARAERWRPWRAYAAQHLIEERAPAREAVA
jgi:AraC family transcriptional regulator of adaptative response / DNA-3-methyladenine glycosylase II